LIFYGNRLDLEILRAIPLCAEVPSLTLYISAVSEKIRTNFSKTIERQALFPTNRKQPTCSHISISDFGNFRPKNPTTIFQPSNISFTPFNTAIPTLTIARRWFFISPSFCRYSSAKLTYAATILDYRDFRRSLACHSSAVN